uniref:KIB1-4 beta-propeller domain-containing protein n=1 Tax=Musa acuminata subsp. malaccensis TaxID=214687 RepID=A0A804HW67_MUSAM|nr:PREDICTED: F-box protein SKIP23-like [Musa acuminata subsp. malaccensis]
MADHVPRIAMWTGLRQHLVKLTSHFLRSASDYIRFRAVCKCWRSAVPPRPRHLPAQLPFLLYLSTPEPRKSSAFCLANAFNGSMRRLPHTTSMYCIGSSYGWLILISEVTSAVSLFNPVTAEDIPLPPLSTLPSFTNKSNNVVGSEINTRT